MARSRAFDLRAEVDPEARHDEAAFRREVQTALLLALLQRGLLTRRQFDDCLAEALGSR